jgi:hypothetical protein
VKGIKAKPGVLGRVHHLKREETLWHATLASKCEPRGRNGGGRTRLADVCRNAFKEGIEGEDSRGNDECVDATRRSSMRVRNTIEAERRDLRRKTS